MARQPRPRVIRERAGFGPLKRRPLAPLHSPNCCATLVTAALPSHASFEVICDVLWEFTSPHMDNE